MNVLIPILNSVAIETTIAVAKSHNYTIFSITTATTFCWPLQPSLLENYIHQNTNHLTKPPALPPTPSRDLELSEKTGKSNLLCFPLKICALSKLKQEKPGPGVGGRAGIERHKQASRNLTTVLGRWIGTFPSITQLNAVMYSQKATWDMSRDFNIESIAD